MNQYDPSRWHVATGTRSRRYPYWVTRTLPSRLAQYYLPNDKGDTRKFASREAAQKAADKLQRTADFDDAREHMRLAVHHMIRATDKLKFGHPLMPILNQMSDLYLELTGRTL